MRAVGGAMRASGGDVGLGVRAALAVLLVGTACIEDRPVAWVPRCGDGVCETWGPGATENPGSCPVDCPIRACENGACEPGEESTCPGDCPGAVCGDGACTAGEDPASCAEDCPWQVCGNHSCEEPDEDPVACPEDCFPGVCGNGLCEDHERPTGCPVDCPPTRDVDVLIVIDNSGSMAAVQSRIAGSLGALLDWLLVPPNLAVNLQVGVTSTDLGAGGYGFTYCEPESSDDGRLLGASAAGLTAGSYLVDVAPEGCDAPVGGDGRCQAPSCPPDACAHAPQTHLVLDAVTGCPRCRNFDGSPATALSAMASLGVMGCGFEQPLEAMARAFARTPELHRPGAVLLVLFVTDEDDCSAENPMLFDPSQTDLLSPLGPATSYRCFEFGVTCDVNQRAIQGLRTGCVPRTDPNRLLFPVDRYATLLLGADGLAIDPGRVILAVFAGPADSGTVLVALDEEGHPEVQPACEQSEIQGRPAIRLRAFAARIHDADDLSRFAFHSLCDLDYAAAMGRIAAAVRERLGS